MNQALHARTATPATVTPLERAAPPHNQLLRWYDGEVHRHLFALPKSVRRRMQAIVDSNFAPISTSQSNNKRVWH